MRLRYLLATAALVAAGSSAATALPTSARGPGVERDARKTQVQRIASRHRRSEEPVETTSDTVGRYAVMRGPHDTGCMLTLDSARVSGGNRAQLAPGCRDQGIVVFDPAAWSLAKGELVLTARAGHKATLAKSGEGLWTKDAAEGGKPLGLKKL